MKVRGWICRAAALVALNATLTLPLSALHPVAIPEGGDPSLHHVISAPKITVVVGRPQNDNQSEFKIRLLCL